MRSYYVNRGIFMLNILGKTFDRINSNKMGSNFMVFFCLVKFLSILYYGTLSGSKLQCKLFLSLYFGTYLFIYSDFRTSLYFVITF